MLECPKPRNAESIPPCRTSRTFSTPACPLAANPQRYARPIITARAPSATAQEGCTIALIPGLTTDAFYITMRKGAEMAAKAVGCELLFQGAPDFNPTTQVPVLQAVIARKPDAILIAPTDKQQLIAPLQQAADAPADGRMLHVVRVQFQAPQRRMALQQGQAACPGQRQRAPPGRAGAEHQRPRRHRAHAHGVHLAPEC